MNHDTPVVAAGSLYDEFRSYPWFISVGIATDRSRAMLILYVRKGSAGKLKGKLPEHHLGYQVKIRETTSTKPAAFPA